MMRTTHKFVLTDEYIKELQQRFIAQDKVLKFVHQTWWAWWLPRIIAVVLSVVLYFINLVSLVPYLAGLLVLSFVGEWLRRRTLAKARRSVRTLGTTSIVTMSDQGLEITSANGNSHLRWTACLPPVLYPDGVLLKFSRLSVIWLPDETLIEGSPADARRLVVENVKDPSHIG